MVRGIHHVAMHTKDFDASVRFYTQVLGMTEYIAWGGEGKRCVMLDTGNGSRLELFEHGFEEREEGPWCHLALDVENCDETYAAALAAGCKTQIEPKDAVLEGEKPLPVRIAFVYGLNGEILEFFQTK